ncbi:MAG: LrgB family protein [Sedimentibacter saalensis]|uniref:LrgB family protein n=1 Tax=Sedimentibacter saalensis TaxID=130788 RepID=UPI0031593BCB
MIKEILTSLFYIIITVIFFAAGFKINKKYKITALNPIIFAALSIGIFLSLFKIPYTEYSKGGKIISNALGPIVVVLAIPLYKNRYELKKNLIPIAGGVVASIITSFASVIILCRLFKIENTILLSLLSKSITNPMAVESTKLLGGNEAITIASVVITGIVGAAVAPAVMKFGKIKSNVAKGIGIGSSSHALGTSKAVEINEETGAASGLAIGVTGLMTIIGIIIFA